jgi:predicted membrane channel-forming protein YqfA (hemolysin III family)
MFYGCLDYSSISVLIFGGFFSASYYLLYCDPLAQVLGSVLMLALNMVGFVGPFFMIWWSPKFRVRRTFIYLSSGLACFIPSIYYFLRYGTASLPNWRTNFGMTGILLMLTLYVTGVAVYIYKVPER